MHVTLIEASSFTTTWTWPTVKRQAAVVFLIIAFISIGLFVNGPNLPSTQAWGLATHMWLTDHAIDELPSGEWKDAFEYFASDVKSGAITPDTVWQDWDNHLYYPRTGQYSAHNATERWFGFMVNNLSTGNWKDGMFFGQILKYCPPTLRFRQNNSSNRSPKRRRIHLWDKKTSGSQAV